MSMQSGSHNDAVRQIGVEIGEVIGADSDFTVDRYFCHEVRQ